MLTKPSSWLKLLLFIVIPLVFLVSTSKEVLTTPVANEVVLPTMLPTVLVTPSASPSASLTPSPTVSPTATPTPSVISESPFTLEEIQGFFEKYSGKYGVDIHYLRHVAVCESGFNPLATNNIYAGLFQFDPATWKSFRNIMDEDPDPNLRFNGKEAVKTAAYLFSIGKSSLWPNCVP
jgi:soluble lytic murein transglycosylase-like protein